MGLLFYKISKDEVKYMRWKACADSKKWAKYQGAFTSGLIQLIFGAIKASASLFPRDLLGNNDSWETISEVNVNFPIKNTVKGTMHGSQTFGPFDLPPGIDSENARLLLEMVVDDDLYIDGKLDDPNIGWADYITKEIEWSPGKTITLDIENSYGQEGSITPHGGSGTIKLQYKTGTKTCQLIPIPIVRNARAKWGQSPIFTSKGTLIGNCSDFATSMCSPIFKPVFELNEYTRPPKITYRPGGNQPPCKAYMPTNKLPKREVKFETPGVSWIVDSGSAASKSCVVDLEAEVSLSFTLNNPTSSSECLQKFLAISAFDGIRYYSSPYGPLGPTWKKIQIKNYDKINLKVQRKPYGETLYEGQECICRDGVRAPATDPGARRAIQNLLNTGQCVAAIALAETAIRAAIRRSPIGAIAMVLIFAIGSDGASDPDSQMPPGYGPPYRS